MQCPMIPPATPNHVAFIIDGNRRWAQELALPSSNGHDAGLANVRSVDAACRAAGIRWRSYYLFSRENAKRDPAEVGHLMEAFTDLFAGWGQIAGESAHIVGDLTSPVITDDLRAASRRLLDAGHQSAKPVCASSNVTFFLNYSGFGAPTPSHTDCLGHVPDIDLIVRTGGEKRLSGFMPPQAAFSELAFIDCYWPEFGTVLLARVLADFAQRNRRFGGNAATPERAVVGGLV